MYKISELLARERNGPSYTVSEGYPAFGIFFFQVRANKDIRADSRNRSSLPEQKILLSCDKPLDKQTRL